MSRNFELLKQLEIEVDGTDHSPLPTVERLVGNKISLSDADEEMLRLVQSVFLTAAGRSLREVVFCGVDEELGSSAVCASAGVALAASGSQSICLVDANVRSPRLSGLFGIDASILPSDKPANVREQCVQISGNLWLAKAELLTDDRGSLVSGEHLKHTLAQLKGMHDYLLIDAPGTTVNRDAVILGQLADAAILVIEANLTRKLAARKAKETFDAVGVRLLGTILNNRTFAIPESIYRRL
jgi:Mrp family chromosome partitioning ATPase